MKCHRLAEKIVIFDSAGRSVNIVGTEMLELLKWVTDRLSVCGNCGEYELPEELTVVRIKRNGVRRIEVFCPMCRDEMEPEEE